MNRKYSFVTTLGVIVLITMSAYAQFPPQGDDTTSSLGSFKVFIASQFVGLFNNPPPNNCPLYDPTSNILSSPSQLIDPNTVIGRSNPIPDGSSPDVNGLPVGSAYTIVSENMLISPPGFPCAGISNCSTGTGTDEVHTEVRSLHMTGSGAAVRAGVWYNSPNGPSSPPAHISPGEVESQSGPSNNPQLDFPASSYFDIFVQVDVPACGLFPGATLYNKMPLVVKNNQVTQFPPKVVYLHDSSSIVPILFLYDDTAPTPRWHKDDILGYFVLVGHGVGFGAGDLGQFNTIMNGQSNATCPIAPPPSASGPATVAPSGTASPQSPPSTKNRGGNRK